jgi:hypothetical protein
LNIYFRSISSLKTINKNLKLLLLNALNILNVKKKNKMLKKKI